MKRILIFITFTLLSISESWASHGVVVTPSSTLYNPNFNTLINVSWNISNGAGTYRSTSSAFTTTGGAQLGASINSSIDITCPNVVTVLCTPRSEEFSIPANVLTAVSNAGLTTILYRRTFFDTKAPANTAIGSFQINFPIPPAPGASAVPTNVERILHISRETLRFNDNSTAKFIKPNTRLFAVAELKFTGTGLLDAFWEYATPSSTTGRPIFIRLSLVRRYLGAGGRVILQSPPLPTDITGQYLVRLQILKTLSNPNGVDFTNDLPDGLPILRYTIGGKGNAGETYLLPPIKTQFPLNNAFLQADTRFNWQAVKNAKAYQLELYLPDTRKRPMINPSTNLGDISVDDSVIENKRPSTGLLIPATETSLALSALSREALKRGQTYYWRIIAIGANGQVLTTSELKEIRTP